MLKRITQAIVDLFAFGPEQGQGQPETEAAIEPTPPVQEQKPVDPVDVITAAITRMHSRGAIGMRLVSDIGQQITIIKPVNADGTIRLGILSHGIPPRVYSHREEQLPISRVRVLMERGTWVVEKGEAHKELLRRAGVKRKAFESSLDDVSIQARNWTGGLRREDDDAPSGPRP